ncbi:hypothetical protein JQ615_28470 [Bradyrhizobium jicamae]|uniref:Uncharacterized protein n=1 Tax=Bradyrhizobium jicamae TaxID=280332 RepID=A0ABS5FRB1_9BRAD|nr:hypothetical protein [Bradyrhizobium jicamae]MBR0938453.1 hypothetical protein [Bradyrhizobium jicamae]
MILVAIGWWPALAMAGPVYDVDLYALMSGTCRNVNVAGRNYSCKAVAYFHNQRGRSEFTVVLDDPADNSHIVSFAGESAERTQDNVFEVSVDRMLLKSHDRPRVDGLPVPQVEMSTGSCRQIGSFVTRQVSSINCAATDQNGKKYELSFESDGSPMTLRRLRQSSLPTERQRARQIAQVECRLKARAAQVLPRDTTAFIIRCLGDDDGKPAGDQR